MGLHLRLVVLICSALLVSSVSPNSVCSQSELDYDHEVLGDFEIKVKTDPPKTIAIDRLFLDPDQDKHLNKSAVGSTARRFLYRISQEGYMAFDETEWVEKIRFKMFNAPATQRQQYIRLAELLTDVNQAIKEYRDTLNDYNQHAMRLLNFCNDPEFKSIDDLEASIKLQRSNYEKLLSIRDDVAQNLMKLTGEARCKDLVEEYRKKLRDLKGSLNKITAVSHTFKDRHEELRKQIPEGNFERGRSSPNNVGVQRIPPRR